MKIRIINAFLIITIIATMISCAVAPQNPSGMDSRSKMTYPPQPQPESK